MYFCVSQVGAGTGRAYGARLHCWWRRRSVNLPGDGGHAEARQKHRPRGARARWRDAVCGGHDERRTYDCSAAQVSAASWIYREQHLMRKLLNTHTNGCLLDDEKKNHFLNKRKYVNQNTPEVAAVPPTIFGSTRIERRRRKRVSSICEFIFESIIF